MNIGKAHAIQNSVKETRNALSAKLFALEETGPTALGPALVVAAGIAGTTSQHLSPSPLQRTTPTTMVLIIILFSSTIGEIPGSEIVLCTDGLSNVGLGRLDDLVTEEDRRSMEEFYRTVGYVLPFPLLLSPSSTSIELFLILRKQIVNMQFLAAPPFL